MPHLRSLAAAAIAAVTLSATVASAQTSGHHGRRPHVIGSNRASSGINAVAPSRAVMNPHSSMYGSGRNILRRMGIRHARIQH